MATPSRLLLEGKRIYPGCIPNVVPVPVITWPWEGCACTDRRDSDLPDVSGVVPGQHTAVNVAEICSHDGHDNAD
jgi:hypothetical protein